MPAETAVLSKHTRKRIGIPVVNLPVEMWAPELAANEPRLLEPEPMSIFSTAIEEAKRDTPARIRWTDAEAHYLELHADKLSIDEERAWLEEQPNPTPDLLWPQLSQRRRSSTPTSITLAKTPA